jgi:hypothetical protein
LNTRRLSRGRVLPPFIGLLTLAAIAVAFLFPPAPVQSAALQDQAEQPFTITSLGDRKVHLVWHGGPGQRIASINFAPNFQDIFSHVDLLDRPSSIDSTWTVPQNQVMECWRVVGPKLCVFPDIAVGAVPRNFSLSVSDTTANMHWEPVPGAQAYLLIPIGSSRVQILPGTATAASDAIGRTPTCYLLAPMIGATVIGISDVLCALP